MLWRVLIAAAAILVVFWIVSAAFRALRFMVGVVLLVALGALIVGAFGRSKPR